MKKISDPSLRPAHLPEIGLYRVNDPGGGVVFALGDPEAPPRAVLTPFRAGHASMVLELSDGSPIAVRGAWDLTILRRGGADFEERVLFCTEQPTANNERVTPEVHAWAMLSLLWAHGAGQRGHG